MIMPPRPVENEINNVDKLFLYITRLCLTNINDKNVLVENLTKN